MEPPGKRLKTHVFDSDEEARAFVQSVPLTRDAWFYILTESPQLTVQDIARMCRVNKQLRALCASGHIWDRIFVRQFGQDALDAARALFPDALLRLMTERVARQTPYRNPAYETLEMFHMRYSARDPHLLYLYYTYNPLYEEYSVVFQYRDEAPAELRQKWARRVGFLPGRRDVDRNRSDVILRGPLAPEQLRRLIYEALQDGFVSEPDARGVRPEDVGCALCSNRARFTCGGCARVAYCGSACAREHWYVQSHNASCTVKNEL